MWALHVSTPYEFLVDCSYFSLCILAVLLPVTVGTGINKIFSSGVPLESLSNDDDDGSENVAKNLNMGPSVVCSRPA